MATIKPIVRNLFHTAPFTNEQTKELKSSSALSVQALISKLQSLSNGGSPTEAAQRIQSGVKIQYDSCIQFGQIKSAQKIYKAALQAGIQL